MYFLNFLLSCYAVILSGIINQVMRRYNRIKAVLADKQKSSKWLAEEVGRSRATVSRWCSNHVQPPLEVLYEVADALEVDVRELLVPNKK